MGSLYQIVYLSTATEPFSKAQLMELLEGSVRRNTVAGITGLLLYRDGAFMQALEGEPMHQFGAPIKLRLDGPFYVGIGFCSHLPDKSDTAIFSKVALAKSAGKVR